MEVYMSKKKSADEAERMRLGAFLRFALRFMKAKTALKRSRKGKR